MTKSVNYKLISALVVSAVSTGLFGGSQVYAGCTPNYGGGQTCIYNKNFDIEKKVRTCDADYYDDHGECDKDDDEGWKDKVTDVEEGDVVEFKIKVKNDGEVDVDDMKMTDKLPKEMTRLGGDGLTEYWDDFEAGDTKKFYIYAKVDDDEFDRKNFEKCVVNKAEVEYDGDEEASDTATVCYGDSEPTELPKTGGNSLVYGALGLGLMAIGATSKKFRK